MPLAVDPLGIEAGLQPAALLLGQPVGFLRPVGEIEQHGRRHDQGRHRLDEEHPLPAMQAADALHIEDKAGDRRADDRGDGNGEHEHADDPRPIGRREPQREKEDDAGEEPGLGHAEQQPHAVEAGFAHDEGLRPGDDAPGHHDAGNPAARAEAVQRQIARHLEEEIGDEENARRTPEGRGGEPQILRHRGPGKADVHPVQIGNEITDHQERHEPPADLGHGSGFNV